jgi:SAM-dependent methyltransferase
VARVPADNGPLSDSVSDSYDAAARAYAEHLFDELAHKPLDRHLLNRFAEDTANRGLVADLGCGPGHVAKYLRDHGVTVTGIDLSPGMVERARELCPGIEFSTGDMRALKFADESLAGIVSFYSIVHFNAAEIEVVARECRRVMHAGALLLMAFHIGDETRHVDELFGQRVSLDFRFHRTHDVINALAAASLKAIEVTEREPYPEVEHQSRRCYILAAAV